MSFSHFDHSPTSATQNTVSTSPERILNFVPPALSVPVPAPKTKTTRQRKRINTAEKRNQHNAIERARREQLNADFLTLAGLVPPLSSSKNPSKASVVNGSIKHLNLQRTQRLLAAKLLRQVCADHDSLLAELNEWRKSSGMPVSTNASAWTEEVEEVCSVEKEVFGTFVAIGREDEDGEETSNLKETMGFDLPNPLHDTFAGLAGIITPRSSNDSDISTGQSIFASHAQPSARDSAIQPGTNGINWSHDFAFSMENHKAIVPTQDPFGSFLNDTFEGSPNSSPMGVNQGQVLTPPTTADRDVKPRTASPSSSHGTGIDLREDPSKRSTHQGRRLTQQQISFLHQHGVHCEAQSQQTLPSPFNASFNRPMSNISGFPMNVQSQPPSTPNIGQFNPLDLQQLYSSMFTQQLFPHHPQTLGQTQTPAGTNTSPDDIKNAVRTGMGLGLGMGMCNFWADVQGKAVEGF